MEPIMKYAELEEQEGDDQRYDDNRSLSLHRQILCVRMVLLSTASPFPFNSFAAKPTAPLMIPQELMMPITPGGSDTSDTDVGGRRW